MERAMWCVVRTCAYRAPSWRDPPWWTLS